MPKVGLQFGMAARYAGPYDSRKASVKNDETMRKVAKLSTELSRASTIPVPDELHPHISHYVVANEGDKRTIEELAGDVERDMNYLSISSHPRKKAAEIAIEAAGTEQLRQFCREFVPDFPGKASASQKIKHHLTTAAKLGKAHGLEVLEEKRPQVTSLFQKAKDFWNQLVTR